MDIKVKVKNSNKFKNELIKELLPKSSKFTIGVAERPHYIREANGKAHSKGIAGIYITSTTEIAAAHEYGLGHTPRRSFIRDTVDKFLWKDAFELASKQYKRVDFFVKAMAKRVYDRVQEAFDTNGFGAWKSLSDKYMKSTGRTNDQILVDTGQLRGAIYSEYQGETITGKKISGLGGKAKRKDYGVSRKARERRDIAESFRNLRSGE